MFETVLRSDAEAVGACLERVIEGDLPLARAMRHAVRGGKGVRGFLVMESARLFRILPEQSVWPGAAIEAVHAYSLVHDDLPCMDDDDLRRGQPTVHRKWDEATAVLAGDAESRWTVAAHEGSHSRILDRRWQENVKTRWHGFQSRDLSQAS